MTVPFLPGGQFRQQSSDILLIADEIIVDDENRSAPAKILQYVELRQHLVVALCAWHTAVDFDDVAKLALKGTAARVLYGHRAVVLHIREVKVRNGRGRKRRALCCLIGLLGLAALEVFHKFG